MVEFQLFYLHIQVTLKRGKIYSQMFFAERQNYYTRQTDTFILIYNWELLTKRMVSLVSQ